MKMKNYSRKEKTKKRKKGGGRVDCMGKDEFWGQVGELTKE